MKELLMISIVIALSFGTGTTTQDDSDCRYWWEEGDAAKPKVKVKT